MRRTMAHQLLTHFRPVRSRHPDPSKEGLVVPPRSIATRSAGGHGLPKRGGRLEARGKFFFTGTQKILLKGVTYGPFAPDAFGSQFHDPRAVAADLDLMAELGANTLRTFTIPPRWLLDLAGDRNLRVLAGIPWAEHVCFLDSKELTQRIRRTVAEAVKACGGHPAVAAYLVGNEIPPDIVRWYGAPRVSAFLRQLVDITKSIDPATLVGYANFPSTEYLETDFTDFLAFNVYLHREEDLRRYLYRLHMLAGDRPLVLTEFGMDSLREGEQSQAATLSRQVRAALEVGVAGTCIFSFTDEWFTGGEDVRDWGFGLVDRDRRTKPAFLAVQRCYDTDELPALSEYPKVSVVVCAYNAESTMAPCLDSLRDLRYPTYEVVVVDDGSTDRTGHIADEYDDFHVIHQENKGLSAARNVGIAASTGDIIAFTDSDCVVDPDWLHYLVATFLTSGKAAVGGPNLPPPEDSVVASCVAASPGGPLHVLLNDEEAEHIPGCNMAFRREVLEEIGGFDPIYRAAGDDVDVCWRLQERGHRIAFSPAAMVWHFRRNTVKAYVGQQRGYGKAEGLLYFKHPQRFNALGYSRWRGRIYGGIYSLFTSLFSLRRPVIYGGVFGRGLSAVEPIRHESSTRAAVSWRSRARSIAFWTENGLEKEVLLQGLQEAVAARKYLVVADRGWSDWDLEVYGGLWSRGRVKVATEYHGAERRVLRAKYALSSSLFTRLAVSGSALISLFGLALGWAPLLLAGLGGAVIGAVAFTREALSLARTINRGLTAVARRAKLHYAPPLRAEVQGR